MCHAYMCTFHCCMCRLIFIFKTLNAAVTYVASWQPLGSWGRVDSKSISCGCTAITTECLLPVHLALTVKTAMGILSHICTHKNKIHSRTHIYPHSANWYVCADFVYQWSFYCSQICLMIQFKLKLFIET